VDSQRDLVERLLPEARQVSKRAWAPYSGVHVGAVAVGAGGATYRGCNVESASYGLTQCAERNALAAAIADGQKPGDIRDLLIFASGFAVLSPCGACRQVISELMSQDAVIVACSDEHPPKTWTVPELFPDPFSLDNA